MMQAYPLVHPIYPERDKKSMIVDAEKVVEQGSSVNGVKGPRPFIPYPRIQYRERSYS